MSNLQIRRPLNRRNSFSSTSSYSPRSPTNTFVPLKLVETKQRNASISNYVKSKGEAQQYVREFCDFDTLRKVKSIYPTNTDEGSYYALSCDKARLASRAPSNTFDPIAATFTFARRIKNDALSSNTSRIPAGGKRKTRRSAKKTRKAKRSHRKGTRRH